MMRLLRALLRLLCSFVIVVLGIYVVVAAAITGFILTGELVPGEPLLHEIETPTLTGTLAFVAVGTLIVAACAWLRQRLAPDRARETPGR